MRKKRVDFKTWKACYQDGQMFTFWALHQPLIPFSLPFFFAFPCFLPSFQSVLDGCEFQRLSWIVLSWGFFFFLHKSEDEVKCFQFALNDFFSWEIVWAFINTETFLLSQILFCLLHPARQVSVNNEGHNNHHNPHLLHRRDPGGPAIRGTSHFICHWWWASFNLGWPGPEMIYKWQVADCYFMDCRLVGKSSFFS